MDFESLTDFSELATVCNKQAFSVSRDGREFMTKRPWMVFGFMLDMTVAGFIFPNLSANSIRALPDPT